MDCVLKTCLRSAERQTEIPDIYMWISEIRACLTPLIKTLKVHVTGWTLACYDSKARQDDSPSATLCSADQPSPRLTQNPGAMKSQKGPTAKNCHSTESVTVRASDLVCELLFIWGRDVFQPQGDFFFFFFLHKHGWFYLDSLPWSKRQRASSTFTMRHRKNITVSSQSAVFWKFYNGFNFCLT